MGSAHSDAVVRIVKELFEEDPYWGVVLTDIMIKLNDGFYDELYVGAIMQKYWKEGAYNIYDAYSFSQIHANICMALWSTCKIHIGTGPEGDKDEEFNNKALLSLPVPFSAKFHGGPGDDDGFLQWDAPIGFGHILPDGDEFSFSLPPRRISLEVGYTTASKTFGHIVAGGVARWPYGQKDIVVIVPGPNWEHPMTKFDLAYMERLGAQ